MQTAGPVSYVKSDPSGLLLGIGSKGCLDIFDVRFDRKLRSIRASYNEPINSINFMNDERKTIAFSNCKQIKFTDPEGNLFTNIEPDSKITRFSVVPKSGMILGAL